MSRKVLIDDDAAQYANLNERLRRLENALAQGRVYAMVRLTATRAWASGTIPQLATPLTWDEVVYDSGGIWDASARLTAPVSGIYEIGFSLLWGDTNTTGARDATIGRNGDTTTRLAEDREAPNTATFSWLHSTAQQSLAAGDWIALYPAQSSGASQNIIASSYAVTAMWMRLAFSL
jgi:hypothetical protein